MLHHNPFLGSNIFTKQIAQAAARCNFLIILAPIQINHKSQGLSLFQRRNLVDESHPDQCCYKIQKLYQQSCEGEQKHLCWNLIKDMTSHSFSLRFTANLCLFLLFSSLSLLASAISLNRQYKLHSAWQGKYFSKPSFYEDPNIYKML